MNRVLFAVVLVLAFVQLAQPQSGTGTVNGTVRDQSGAVIPAAEVVLTNTATNVASTRPTNAVGFYIFTAVIPGPYRISVSAAGMGKYEATFVVQVTQTVAVDAVLQPSTVATTVEVTAMTSTVNVSEGTVRSTMDSARIEQLPLNARRLDALLNVLPGSEGDGGRRMFGEMTVAQEWIIDGVPVTGHRWDNVVASYNPGVASLQEFAVDSNAVSAKETRPSNIVFITKSGTNKLHGSAYETNRNSGIGVARARTDYYAKPPHLVRNEFGISSGGPVVIPGIYNGKDKTFWFFNYEGYRERAPVTRSYTVPTAAMRTGDFSELKDSQGRLQTLYNPWTTDTTTWLRQPFAYGGKANVIDPSRMNDLAKYIFSITPLPTTADNPLVADNIFLPTPYDWDKSVYVAKIDHRFSDRDGLTGRLTRMGFDNLTSYTTGWNLPYLNGVAGWKTSQDREYHASMSWNHTFSPTFFNEVLVAGYYHRGEAFLGKSTQVSDKNWFTELKVPNPFNYKGWPGFGTVFGSYKPDSTGTGQEKQAYYIVDDNATKVLGKHELTFGVHYRTDPLAITNTSGSSSYNWGTLATSLFNGASRTAPAAAPQTGHNLGNMAIGVGTYSQSIAREVIYVRSGQTALYFQDNFKATPRLTLNLGMRWERWPAIREKRNQMFGFDPASHSTVLGTDLQTSFALGITLPSVVNAYTNLGWKYKTWDQAGLPQTMAHANNKNFAPRLGFAYRALGGAKSFVVRGGYSLSYFAIDINSWVGDVTGGTPASGTFNYNPSDGTQTPDGIANYGLRSVPLFTNGNGDSQAISLNSPRSITRGTASATGFAPRMPTSRTHAWNLTLEKQVMQSTVVRAGYIGNHSSNLLQFYSYNDATPDYIWYKTTGLPTPTGEYINVARRPYDQTVLGSVREFRNTGWGNAQNMNFELERRFSKGYAYQLSYVISNVMYAGNRSTVNTPNLYLPNAIPSDYGQLDRFLNYARDTGVPKHRVKWNWLIELPFGKGKLLGRNANSILDKFIGGWQLAGIGTLRSTYFSLGTGNWNITGEPIQIYGYKYPIQNCTSGTCQPGYLWWNGYIPANQINSVNATTGKPNGYMGVPANYKPAVTPLIPYGSTTVPANFPANGNLSSFWDSNNVWLPLTSGAVQQVSYNTNLHPWRNQYMPSIRQWNQDASLFKNFAISERFNLRLAGDFFNVFNHPGNPNSLNAAGFLNCQSSGAANPRILQLSLKLDW